MSGIHAVFEVRIDLYTYESVLRMENATDSVLHDAKLILHVFKAAINERE